MILSYLGWWQNSEAKLDLDAAFNSSGENYLDHFSFCSDNHYGPSCFGPYGGPIAPSNVLGGFNKTKGNKVLVHLFCSSFANYNFSEGRPDYKSSRSVLVNYFISDFVQKDKNLEALAWEASFITFLKNFTQNDPLARDVFDVAFTSGRSIEDEISAASRGEVSATYLYI